MTIIFSNIARMLQQAKRSLQLLAVLSLGLLTQASWAQNLLLSDKDQRLELVLSPGLTYHYNADTNHRPVRLAGAERINAKTGDLQGLVLFSNSFGQPSAYLYPWGAQKSFSGEYSRFYWKWTAGLLYGYKPPYENKVPLNYKGFSPGFIAAVGYEWSPQVNVQLNALGTAALMLSVNIIP